MNPSITPVRYKLVGRLAAIVCLSFSLLNLAYGQEQEAEYVHDDLLYGTLGQHLVTSNFTHQNTTANCQQCHTSAPKTDDSPMWRVLLGTDTGEEHFAQLYFLDALATGLPAGTVLPTAGIQLGNYRIGNLSDPILRSHLKLGKQNALVVLAADNNDNGLAYGDVLLKIDGKEIESVVKLYQKLDAEENGPELTFEGIRTGEPLMLTIDLHTVAPAKQPYRIGVRVEEPSEAIRSQLKLYSNEGILVTEVVEDSPAAEEEIAVHDILLRAGETRLSNLEDLRKAVQTSNGSPVKVVLMRGGEELTVSIQPRRAEPEPSSQTVICPGIQTSWGYAPTAIDLSIGDEPLRSLYFDAQYSNEDANENPEGSEAPAEEEKQEDQDDKEDE